MDMSLRYFIASWRGRRAPDRKNSIRRVVAGQSMCNYQTCCLLCVNQTRVVMNERHGETAGRSFHPNFLVDFNDINTIYVYKACSIISSP